MVTPISEAMVLFDGFVESASLSAGYGTNSSTCQLSLVYEDDGPKRPHNVNVDGQWFNHFEAKFPPLGTAVGFKAGACEFVGLFQKYTNQRSLSGYKWDIILESPAKLLDGIQIILDEFQGTSYTGANPGNPSLDFEFTDQISNIWNPFAVLENYNNGGIFGGADVNSLGFPAIDSLDQNGDLRKGALTLIEEISRGEHPYGGKAKFGVSEFSIDLSELIAAIKGINNATGFSGPATPNAEFIRIKGPTQSLGSIIQELCTLIMYDFSVVLLPANGEISNGVVEDLVIKIKMIDKSKPPNPNAIKDFVDRYERGGRIVSANIGKELSDAVTQKLVIGDRATRYYVATSSQMIQIWGKTKSRIPRYVSYIILDDGSYYPADPLEVRCAMSSFDSWVLYHIIQRQIGNTNPAISSFANALFTRVKVNDYVIEKILSGEATVNDLIDSSAGRATSSSQIYDDVDPQEGLKKIYNAVASAGSEYYGKKYYVPLPMEPGGMSNNIRYITDDQSYETSWDISQSAWYASVEGGILNEDSGIYDVSFYDDSGMLKQTGTWAYSPMNTDYSALGSNYCNTGRGIASQISVDDEIYWISNQAYAIVDVPSITQIDNMTTNDNGLYKLLNALVGIPISAMESILGVGSDNNTLGYGIVPANVPPVYVGIPQVSNRYRWGPWWGWKSKTGKAEIVIEDSLSPQTYGGMVAANDVGFSYASVQNAEVTGVESGSVELAELPIGNIGSRFAVSGPYISGMDLSVGTGGVTTTYKFNTWTPEFGRLAKYNIDRFANINKSSIRMAQAQRAMITKKPIKPLAFNESKMRGRDELFGGLGFMGMSFSPNGKIQNTSNGGMKGVLAATKKDSANTYGNSQEQIWTGVEISKTPPTSQTKPQILAPKTSSGGMFQSANVAPTSHELNPYFAHSDNDFQNAVVGDEGAQSFNIQEIGMQNIQKVRINGLRGPIILSGWGYDINDMPVPALGTDGNDRFEFADDVAINRNKWKTGPVDLRWDDDRKVWGAGFHVIEGVLTGSITAPSTASNKTTFNIDVKRSSSWTGRSETVQITNRDPSLEITWKSEYSGKILVVAIKINSEYRPIWVGCPDNL